MLLLEDLIQSIRDEERIILHLFEKIPEEEGLQYQPTQYQRTTYELLQYIAHMPRTMIRAIANGDFSHAKETSGIVESMDTRDFPLLFSASVQEVIDTLQERGEEGLKKEKMLMGMKRRAVTLVLDMLIKNFTAYRMQLFLYAKQA